jgi:hypothetical protein
MLIRTSKFPGWGKVKPRQWGPLSAVRSAVFRNAERMGIDPRDIAGVATGWHFHDVMTATTPSFSSGTLSLTTRGVLLDGGYATYAANKTIGTASQPYSFFTACRLPQNLGTTRRCVGLSFGNTYHTSLEVRKSFIDNNDTYNYIECGATDAGRLRLVESALGGGFGAGGGILVMAGGGQGSTADIVAQLQGSSTVATISGACTSSASARDNLRLGRTTSDGAAYSEVMLSVAFVTRLPAALMQELVQLPYALLMPNPTPVFFDLAAGGGLSGESSVTLAPVVQISTGLLQLAGGSTQTLATIIISADGTVMASGAHAVMLDSVTAGAEGDLLIAGAHAAALQSLQMTAAGELSGTLQGSSVATLEALAALQAGNLLVSGQASATLDGVQAVSEGVNFAAIGTLKVWTGDRWARVRI